MRECSEVLTLRRRTLWSRSVVSLWFLLPSRLDLRCISRPRAAKATRSTRQVIALRDPLGNTRWHALRHVRLRSVPVMVAMLRRLRHGLLKKRFVVSPGLDELLIELGKVVLLLGVLLDQLDQLWPNRQCLVVKFLEIRC